MRALDRLNLRAAAAAPVPAALAVTLGAGLLLMSPRLPAPVYFALVTLPALLPWRGRALYALACLGFLAAGWQPQRGLTQRWPAGRDGATVSVRGAISSLPQDRSVGYGRRTWRFLFQPAAHQDAELPPRIRVSWYWTRRRLGCGQCWRLRLKIKAPLGSGDLGAFDYERWLFSKSIGATAWVRDGRPCGKATGFFWLRAREGLRRRLDGWLQGVPGRPLVDTLVLGDRSGLHEADWRVFRATGTNHLVAVAGLHLAIIAAAVFFLLHWLWVLWPARHWCSRPRKRHW